MNIAFHLRRSILLSLVLSAAAERFALENDQQRRHNESTAGSSAEDDLPRPCKKGMFFGLVNDECCSCGKRAGDRAFLGKLEPTCLYENMGKVCCPAWAVDCQPTDYWYKQGMSKDCAGQDEETCVQQLKLTQLTEKQLEFMKRAGKEDERTKQMQAQMDRWNKERRQKEHDARAQRNQAQRDKTKKAMTNMVNSVGAAVASSMQGKKCCQCKIEYMFSTTVENCEAPDCSVYQRNMGGHACKETGREGCSKRPTACAADPGYYAKQSQR